MPLFSQNLHLGLCQPGETEHANLVGHVIPSARGALGLQSSTQALTHFLDTAAHGPEILLPLGEQLGVVENTAGNPSPVRGGIGDLGTLQDSELSSDVLVCHRSIRSGSRDEVESTRTLAVQTQILRERLSDTELEALLGEIANGPRVADQITGREALIGGVEEGEMLTLADHRGDFLPLLLGGIYAGRVMGTGVEKDDGAGQGRAQGLKHAIDI